MPNPRIMVYDIETAPMKAWVWNCGKQYLGHKQLEKGPRGKVDIITISWVFNDGKAAKSLDWGWEEQDSKPMIEKFDLIIKDEQEAGTIVFGKNNKRFDDKHINAQRLIHDLPPLPDWTKYTEDLEKQCRKYFNFPSQSLDYLSKLFELGGKDKMEFQDWIDIVEKNDPSKLAKMIRYNKKDCVDTLRLIEKVLPHIELKNKLVYNPGNAIAVCKACGSTNIRKNGTRGNYRSYYCNNHNGYAGRALIGIDGEPCTRVI